MTRPGHIGHRYEGDSSFAVDVEPIELVETRRELLREAQVWLTIWERGRDLEARGRLLQCMDVLGWLVREHDR